MADLYFNIGADFSELNKIQSRIQDLENQLRNVNPVITPKVEITRMENDLRKAKAQFAQLSMQAASAGRQISQTGVVVNSTGNSFSNMANNVRSANAALSETGKGMNGLEQTFMGVQGGVAAFTRQFGAFALTMKGLYAMMGAFQNAAGTIMSFEAANSTLAAILGKNKEDIAELTAAAERLGRDTMFTASQVTQLQTELSKLGFKQQPILDMQRSILDFAQATGAALPDAASTAGAAIRMFGVAEEDYVKESRRFTSAMATATMRSALNFQAISDNLATFAPMAHTMGLEIEDVLALFGKLKDAGIESSTAMTSLRNIFTKIAQGKVAGIGEVHSLDDLIAGLNTIAGSGDGSDVGKMMKQIGPRGGTQFIQLIQAKDTIMELRDEIKAGAQGATLDEMSSKMMGNLAGQLKILQSSWEDFILTFRNSDGIVADFVSNLAEGIRKVRDFISEDGDFTREQLESVASVIGTILTSLAVLKTIQWGKQGAGMLAATGERAALEAEVAALKARNAEVVKKSVVDGEANAESTRTIAATDERIAAIEREKAAIIAENAAIKEAAIQRLLLQRGNSGSKLDTTLGQLNNTRINLETTREDILYRKQNIATLREELIEKNKLNKVSEMAAIRARIEREELSLQALERQRVTLAEREQRLANEALIMNGQREIAVLQTQNVQLQEQMTLRQRVGSAMSKGFGMLKGFFDPMTLGIMGVVAAISLIKNAWDEAHKSEKRLIDTMDEISEANNGIVKDQNKAVERVHQLTTILQTAREDTDYYRKAHEELLSLYKERGVAIEELAKAQENEIRIIEERKKAEAEATAKAQEDAEARRKASEEEHRREMARQEEARRAREQAAMQSNMSRPTSSIPQNVIPTNLGMQPMTQTTNVANVAIGAARAVTEQKARELEQARLQEEAEYSARVQQHDNEAAASAHERAMSVKKDYEVTERARAAAARKEKTDNEDVIEQFHRRAEAKDREAEAAKNATTEHIESKNAIDESVTVTDILISKEEELIAKIVQEAEARRMANAKAKGEEAENKYNREDIDDISTSIGWNDTQEKGWRSYKEFANNTISQDVIAQFNEYKRVIDTAKQGTEEYNNAVKGMGDMVREQMGYIEKFTDGQVKGQEANRLAGKVLNELADNQANYVKSLQMSHEELREETLARYRSKDSSEADAKAKRILAMDTEALKNEVAALAAYSGDYKMVMTVETIFKNVGDIPQWYLDKIKKSKDGGQKDLVYWTNRLEAASRANDKKAMEEAAERVAWARRAIEDAKRSEETTTSPDPATPPAAKGKGGGKAASVDNEAKRRAEQERKRNDLIYEYMKMRRELEAKMEEEIAKAKLNAMKEGSAKTLAELRFEHEARIKELKKQANDERETAYNELKKIWDADPDHQGKPGKKGQNGKKATKKSDGTNPTPTTQPTPSNPMMDWAQFITLSDEEKAKKVKEIKDWFEKFKETKEFKDLELEFDYSFIEGEDNDLIIKKFNALIEEETKKFNDQIRAMYEKEQDKLIKYQNEYGTFLEKMNALRLEYEREVSREGATEVEIRAAKKKYDKAVKDASMAKYEELSGLTYMLGNLDAYNAQALEQMANALERIILANNDLSPEGLQRMQSLQGAWTNISNAMSEKPFKDFAQYANRAMASALEGYEKWRDALETAGEDILKVKVVADFSDIDNMSLEDLEATKAKVENDLRDLKALATNTLDADGNIIIDIDANEAAIKKAEADLANLGNAILYKTKSVRVAVADEYTRGAEVMMNPVEAVYEGIEKMANAYKDADAFDILSLIDPQKAAEEIDRQIQEVVNSAARGEGFDMKFLSMDDAAFQEMLEKSIKDLEELRNGRMDDAITDEGEKERINALQSEIELYTILKGKREELADLRDKRSEIDMSTLFLDGSNWDDAAKVMANREKIIGLISSFAKDNGISDIISQEDVEMLQKFTDILGDKTTIEAFLARGAMYKSINNAQGAIPLSVTGESGLIGALSGMTDEQLKQNQENQQRILEFQMKKLAETPIDDTFARNSIQAAIASAKHKIQDIANEIAKREATARYNSTMVNAPMELAQKSNLENARRETEEQIAELQSQQAEVELKINFYTDYDFEQDDAKTREEVAQILEGLQKKNDEIAAQLGEKAHFITQVDAQLAVSDDRTGLAEAAQSFQRAQPIEMLQTPSGENPTTLMEEYEKLRYNVDADSIARLEELRNTTTSVYDEVSGRYLTFGEVLIKNADAQAKMSNAQKIAQTYFSKSIEQWQRQSNAISKANGIIRQVGGLFQDLGKKKVALVVSSLGDLGDSLLDGTNEIKDMIHSTRELFLKSADGAKMLSEVTQESGKSMKDITTAAIASMSAVEKASVILTIISVAFQVVQKIFNFAKEMHNQGLQDDIDEMNRKIEDLKEAYKDLETAVGKAYSKEQANLIEQQQRNIEAQNRLIRKQIEDEKKLKEDEDERKDKLRDYESQIKDNERQLRELKESAKDAIFGTDIQNAIESFAEAYTSAISDGSSFNRSAKELAVNMLKTMITTAMKSDISKYMGTLRDKMVAFMDDGVVTADEQANIENAFAQQAEELHEKWKWSDNILKGKTLTEGASSGGFEAMSQDSADELNGRFAALQMSGETISRYTILNYEGLSLINATAEQIAAAMDTTNPNGSFTRLLEIQADSFLELQGINANTLHTAEGVQRVEIGIQQLNSRLRNL